MSKRKFQWIMIPALVAVHVAAQAVHLSDSGRGGALVVPYWTGAGGNDTLITVRNHGTEAAALKVRMMDTAGAEVHVFNLYLDGRATWTAAVSDAPGVVSLISHDESCVLPTNNGDAVALAAESGYIEIIEMGRAKPGVGLQETNDWIGCSSIAERFDSGVWRETPDVDISQPAGAISASASLIHVEVGAMVTIDATALAGFSDIPQHTGPESDTPNLSTPNDSGAGSFKTRSRICTESECRTDAWDLPVEAVAAVLMGKAIEADVVINPTIGARTELVVVRPLERYKSQGMLSFTSEPKLLLRRRNGTRINGSEGPCICLTACCEVPGTWFPVGSLHAAVDVVTMNAAASEVGMEQRSPVLSAPTIPGFSLDDRDFVAGVARVVFDQGGPAVVEISIRNDDIRMGGEPVIGFVIQQFTNGTLIDADGSRIRANYRAAVEWARERDLREKH